MPTNSSPVYGLPAPTDDDPFILGSLRLRQLRDKLEAILTGSDGPAWTALAAILYGTTTNPNLGNGTADCRYTKNGRHVTAVFAFEFGSAGASVGNGFYEVDLAALPAPRSSIAVTASGWLRDSSSATYQVAGVVAAGGTRYRIFGPAGMITHASPWAWAVGDRIIITLTYESAA